MKNALILLVMLTIASPGASAQYISMAIDYSKPEKYVQTGRPLKVTEIYRSRLFGKKNIYRKEITYNWTEKRINYCVYKKDGMLVHQIETNLDSSLQRVLYLVNVNYEPKRIFRDSFWFSYDTAGILARMICSFNDQQSITHLKAGTDGFPAEAHVVNSQGKIIEMRRMEFHPEDNYYVFIPNTGKKIEKPNPAAIHRLEQDKYSSLLDEKMEVNKHGDIILRKNKADKNKETAEYQNEYEYDDRGNWIKKNAYIIDRKTGKRKLISRSEREIVYGD